MTTIPERFRRRALHRFLYRCDGVKSYAGGMTEGDPVIVEYGPLDGEHRPPTDEEISTTARDVKLIAGALGFSYASEGRFQVRLKPDAQHAMGTLRGLEGPTA